MKNIIVAIFLFTFLACNSSSEKKPIEPVIEPVIDTPKSMEKQVTKKAKSSADYNLLLSNFECDVSISELAQVLNVSQEDISIPDNTVTTVLPHCLFSLSDYGDDRVYGGTQLQFGPFPSTKGRNRNLISEFLERKKDGFKIMGTDIEQTETGDLYIITQPNKGSITILGENISKYFLINYGIKNAKTTRTKEQHEALQLKMKDLAYYLIKKYKK